MNPSPPFLLVDGHHLAYRSFHALPASLCAPDGTPTGALLGFARGVRSLRQQWRPDRMAVVFDGGLPAARLAALPEYKAHRPPMPDGLRRQLDLIREYLELCGVPWLQVQGEESDDVIATLAAAAERDGAEVGIASGDKDLLQLVGGRVFVIRADAPAVRVDAAAVERLLGVPPAQVTDLLALTGDASDNIPGVLGVGPVTARRLLAAAGGLPALWERLPAIAPARLRDRLAAARAMVERNATMVRLRRDVPGLPAWTTLECRQPDPTPLRAFLERLGLRSLMLAASQPELF